MMPETHGVGVPNQDAPGVAFAEQPELVPEKAATLGRHFIAMLESRDSWSCARKAATAGHIGRHGVLNQ